MQKCKTMKGVQRNHRCYLWDLKRLVGGELNKRRRTQRLPHISPQQPQPTEDSRPGPSGTTGSESSLGGQREGGSGETGQPPIGGGAESEPQTLTIDRGMFNALLTRIDMMEKKNLLMEQKILLLEQQKSDQDNEILRLENKLIEMQQELEKVRSQPPAGSSSTQQQNVRIDTLQSDLIQLETVINKIKEGFSDDFLNQGTATAQGLDKIVEELKQKLDTISHPNQPNETPFQYWKRRACDEIGTSKQGEKATTPFGCFDSNCNWQGKTVTLNAYILHLKRHHGQNIKTNPDLQYLPSN